MESNSGTESSILYDIPNEIWAAILENSLLEVVEQGQWEIGQMYKMESSVYLAMSQVCSTWRNLALSSPNLWRYIYFRIDHTHKRIYPHQNLVLLWLQRSKQQPLRVKLLAWGLELASSEPSIQKCLFEVFATIPRWQFGYLDIHHSGRDVNAWHTLEPHINVSAPLLERLHINASFVYIDNVGDRSMVLPENLWTTSAHLRELSVEMVGDIWTVLDTEHVETLALDSPISLTRSAYDQLTHLRLTDCRLSDGFAFSWEHILTILNRTPNLVSCFLEGAWTGRSSIRGFTGIGGPVVLQHLQYLYLKVYEPSHEPFPAPLERMLIAPSLEALTLSNRHNFDQGAYTRFIAQSSCPLYELHLVRITLTPEDFLQCLRLSPTLKLVHLDQIDAMANAEVCSAMGEWNEAGQEFKLVPRLQALSLTKDPLSVITGLHTDVVEEMLKARLCPPNGSSLESFTILGIPLFRKQSPSAGLRDLCGSPWNLQLAANDNFYQIDSLWDCYGGELS